MFYPKTFCFNIFDLTVFPFQGGMESHLFTCCGSPAYAAPELVAGKQYVGAEVCDLK